MLYVGSEGDGGLVATDLGEAPALLVGLPGLQDALAEPFEDGRSAALLIGAGGTPGGRRSSR